jgi:phosphoribosylformylglycinamidine synthase
VFETPVTGGNVSLFNETDGRAIYPTPVIGMVGVIEDVSKIVRSAFRAAGDDIVLLGENTGELGGSEYLYVTAALVAGQPPSVDLAAEKQLQQALLRMIGDRLLHSAHDCAQGGLACALAESALGDGEAPLGVRAEIADDLRPVVALFGEAHGRVVVSCDPSKTDELLRTARRYDVPARRVGKVVVAEEGFRLAVRDGTVEASVADMADAFFRAIPRRMDAKPSTAVEEAGR